MAPTTPNKTTAPQTLFFLGALPAELRNMIYNYVLQSPELYNITTMDDAKQPALLQVNSQIRHEAIGLYYTHRDFGIHIINFDSLPLQLFWQHASHYLPQDALTLTIVEDFKHPSWKHLIGWAKAYYKDENFPVPLGGSRGSDANETFLRMIMRDVFDTVDDFAEFEWKNCLWAVQELRDTPMWRWFKWRGKLVRGGQKKGDEEVEVD